MSEKLCVFCEHMSWGLYGHHDYYEGDVVGGGYLKCNKGRWRLERETWDVKDLEDDPGIIFAKSRLADAIQLAKMCDDYTPPK